VNFFQPSFKLKEKLRVGGRAIKRRDAPQIQCARLLAQPGTPTRVRTMLEEAPRTRDPLRLLEEIRGAQHQARRAASLMLTRDRGCIRP